MSERTFPTQDMVYIGIKDIGMYRWELEDGRHRTIGEPLVHPMSIPLVYAIHNTSRELHGLGPAGGPQYIYEHVSPNLFVALRDLYETLKEDGNG